MKLSSLVLLLLMTAWSSGQDNSWDKRSDFGGFKRERAVAFSVGDYGYVGTGTDTAEVVHADLWRFDPSANTWTQMANMPASVRRNAIAFVIGTKGYVGTGVDSNSASLGTKLDDFWEYDPSSNAWDQKADYPGAGGLGVYHATGFAVGDKGFICSGKIGPDNYVFDLWEYNPTLDSWTARTSFPGGDRYGLSSFVVEGKAYVGMGTDHDVYRKDWWEYDPATFTWTAKADLPGSERSAASTFTLGQRGFVVFGTDGGYSNQLWEYNPFTDSWNIKAPFPTSGRKGAIAFTVGDTAYAGTGKGSSGKKKSIYAYIPGIVGITEKVEGNAKVYPNPIQTNFSLEVSNHFLGGVVYLFDSKGSAVWAEKINSEKENYQRGELSSGFYSMVIYDSNGNNQITKTLIFE